MNISKITKVGLITLGSIALFFANEYRINEKVSESYNRGYIDGIIGTHRAPYSSPYSGLVHPAPFIIQEPDTLEANLLEEI